ncbi:MAG: cysteine--tRNA ligase [Deltaproteobacteria bacterium]|nr:cysteine--tRNA ligase [Deltaproteobacteria bacterium]
MPLKIYDTLTGQKVALEPIHAGEVRIYVCGPTVYDMAHIGHARAYVAFDTAVRFLRRRYKVTYVRNYTDVDDKIIKRAAEVGEDPAALAARFIREFELDMQALAVNNADVQPKVTEHMAEIIDLVATLVAKGAAYVVDGDVYFAVDKFEGYGALGRRDLTDMEAGARVEVDLRKRHPMDFALWKAAKPGEPFWESPWGQGRPGWHIECSAMSSKYLGETFDIHGGGKDLIFPHHENEIAQSRAASGKPFAKVWMHNGFVNVDNQKMSKSLGNFFTVRDVLQKFDPQTLRYFLLTTHYRSPISFSDQTLKETEARVKYLYETLARLEAKVGEGSSAPPYTNDELQQVVARFEATMEDDFNTAKALGDLSEVFTLVNDLLQRDLGDTELRTLRFLKATLTEVGAVLGLFVEPPKVVLERMAARKQADRGVDQKAVEALIALRAEARKAKDFARADAIRKELLAMGVNIKDSAAGTTWELA